MTKIIPIRCPTCGSGGKIPETQTRFTCQYCGNSYSFDNEIPLAFRESEKAMNRTASELAFQRIEKETQQLREEKEKEIIEITKRNQLTEQSIQELEKQLSHKENQSASRKMDKVIFKRDRLPCLVRALLVGTFLFSCGVFSWSYATLYDCGSNYQSRSECVNAANYFAPSFLIPIFVVIVWLSIKFLFPLGSSLYRKFSDTRRLRKEILKIEEQIRIKKSNLADENFSIQNELSKINDKYGVLISKKESELDYHREIINKID